MIATKGLPDLQTGGRHSIATGRTRWPELRDSMSPERLAPGARARRSGRKAPAGIGGNAGDGSPKATVPAGQAPETLTAAAETAGGQGTGQIVGD